MKNILIKTIIILLFLNTLILFAKESKGVPSKWEVTIPLRGFPEYGLTNEEKLFNQKAPLFKLWAEKEMSEITNWMKKMEYPIDTKSIGKVRVPSKYGLFDENKGEYGHYDANSEEIIITEKSIKHINLKNKLLENIYKSEILQKFHSNTLAHELSHAIHFKINDKSFDSEKKFDWINEGIPDAIAQSWTIDKYNGAVTNSRANYHEPLHLPINPYSRAHFFQKLGLDLKLKKGKMSYVIPLLQKDFSKDKSNGIDWLDNYLKESKLKSLFEYYPQFIANHTEKKFFKKTIGTINHVHSIKIPSKQIKTIEIPIEALASTYNELEVEFKAIDGLDKEKIYLLVVDIPTADKIQDLSLIVGQEKPKRIHKGSERDISILFAQKGKVEKPLIINVTNVAKKASNSKRQKLTLRIKATPISFEFPTCMKVGTTSHIKLNGDITLKEFFSLENVKLKANGKIIKNIEYIAPNISKKVQITLTLPTIDGKEKIINLHHIDVQQKSCGILMTIAKSNMKIIWDAKRQVTDVSMGRGVKLLMTDVFMYARSNNGTWIQMLIDEKLPVVTDLGFGAIKMNSFRNVKDMSMISPKDFVARFSWENALKEAKKSTMRCIEKTPKYCTVNETRWDYDSSNRLIKASNHEVDMNFKYGSYSATPIPLNAKFITSPMNFEFTGLSNMKPKEVQDMLKNIIPELGDKQSIRKMLDAL